MEFTTPEIYIDGESEVKDDIKSITDILIYYSKLYNTRYLHLSVDTKYYKTMIYPHEKSNWIMIYVSMQNDVYEWDEMWTGIGLSYYGFYAYRLGVTKIGDPSTIKLDIKTLTIFLTNKP